MLDIHMVVQRRSWATNTHSRSRMYAFRRVASRCLYWCLCLPPSHIAPILSVPSQLQLTHSQRRTAILSNSFALNTFASQEQHLLYSKKKNTFPPGQLRKQKANTKKNQNPRGKSLLRIKDERRIYFRPTADYNLSFNFELSHCAIEFSFSRKTVKTFASDPFCGCLCSWSKLIWLCYQIILNYLIVLV